LQFNKVRSDGKLETMFQANGVKSLTAIKHPEPRICRSGRVLLTGLTIQTKQI
jgi:hypothetical protein